MAPRSVKFLIFIHICISFTGMLAHFNQHPVGKSLYFLWAATFSVFSLIVIPILFYRPSTVAWGFMMNAGTIIIGTIGMSYYSLLTIEAPINMNKILLESTLPAIIILWTKLPVSYFILKQMKPLIIPKRIRGCEIVQDRT